MYRALSKGSPTLCEGCVQVSTRLCAIAARAMSTQTTPSLPDKADVVIVGGGVVGCSTAYHIRERLPDSSVVLLEQASLGGGTTWHAAGLVGLMRASKSETLLSGVYGTQLYQKLQDMTDLSAGYKRCGSVSFARTSERLELLRRTASRARSYGLEAHEVTVQEANEMCGGIFDESRYVGAISLPGDGAIDASNTCALFAAAARKLEAKIFERMPVTAVTPHNGGKDGFTIGTKNGEISAKFVVNCAGQWARKLGQLSGVNIPLHSCEHFYAYTRPGSFTVPSTFPVVRDPDGYLYAREWSRGLLVGSFEPSPKPCFDHGVVPDGFEFSLLDNDWDHFLPYLEDAVEHIPSLADAEIDLLNGPESFTMDNSYLMGEAVELRNYFVAAGMNSSGIASAGGVGHHIAEWIAQGYPKKHVWNIDIRRVQSFQENQRYIRTRACESLGDHYRLVAPKREAVTARGIRRSPLFDVLRDQGACFGQKAGWERPNYFSPDAMPSDPYVGPGLQPETWGEAVWMPHARNEHIACRTGATLFDMSSFAKFLLVGEDAESVVSSLCANEVRSRKGYATYTQMCNDHGGIEADVTVRQLSCGSWLVLTATDKGPRDRAWIEHRSEGKRITIVDVSPTYSVLALMGPSTPQILSQAAGLTSGGDEDQFKGWKPNEARELDLGCARVTAIRTSYVGERAGWELHMDSGVARHVYDVLHDAAALAGNTPLTNAGYLAIDSLRIEAGRLAWGHELTPEETPYEAGLGFAVKLNKPGGFIGQSALSAQLERGVSRRCCIFEVCPDNDRSYVWGGEPLIIDGSYSGENITSGARVPTSSNPSTPDRTLALGYVRSQEGPINSDWLTQHHFEIELGQTRVPVTPKILGR